MRAVPLLPLCRLSKLLSISMLRDFQNRFFGEGGGAKSHMQQKFDSTCLTFISDHPLLGYIINY